MAAALVAAGAITLAGRTRRRRVGDGGGGSPDETPSLDPETLDSLRHPLTGEALEWIEDAGGRRGLATVPSGRRVGTRDGFVDLLVADDLVGTNRAWQGRYDRIAPFYDLVTRTYARARSGGDERRVREYLDALDVRPGQGVLEVSVGTGRNLRYLPPEARYVGLDLSIGMLRVCRAKLRRWGRRADLVLGTAEHLPFADATFDTVLHVGGINFFIDPRGAVAEMARVVRPGGQVLVVDETERVARAYRRPATRPAVDRPAADPTALVPPGMVAVELTSVAHGELYRLTFRTPAGAAG